EEFPDTTSYPDAMWLRGETFYAAHDYLAARRDYRDIVDHGDEHRFQGYFGRALARLVDVSLRLNDPPETLAPIFEKFNRVPPAPSARSRRSRRSPTSPRIRPSTGT